MQKSNFSKDEMPHHRKVGYAHFLQAAILALQKMEAVPLVQLFTQSPGSRYLQQACFLWELANRQTLDAPDAKGATRPLFDPERFLTNARAWTNTASPGAT